MSNRENHKKKLLITASTFPRWIGDSEPRFVFDLAVHMTDKFDITILVPMAKGAKEKEEINGIRIIRYHYFPVHKWEELCYPGAIVPRIKEKKRRVLLVPFLFIALFYNVLCLLPEYDIVHAHWLIPQGIIQSLFKKPFVVTGHGGDVTSLNHGLIRLLKKRCIRKAKTVTVVSEALKREVLLIEQRSEVKVISMGCNTEKFGEKNHIDNYFKQDNKKVVLFVGRLAEKKGVKYLIEAVRNLDVKLVIVGEGPLESELKKQAKSQGNKVVFLGAKSHEQLITIYASADLFIAPSIVANDGDMEGFGLVMLEAMASGLPVIASDSGGISDVIKDGFNGILFEEKNVKQLESKINELLKNDILYKELHIHAQEVAAQFDYKIIAQKYEKILLDS